MQTIKSYFAPNWIRGQLIDLNNVDPNEETFMYSTPIKLYSGVNNPVKIECLNADQKRVNVSNITIQAGLFEPESQNELIILTATPYDSPNGLVTINYTSSNIAPLDFGFYEIALTATDDENNIFPIYINDYQGSRLTVELLKGPVLAYPNPTPVTFVDTVGVGVVSNQTNLTNRPMNSTVCTLGANLVSYTGNIVAQFSLTSTPTNTDWGNVSSVYYSNVSGPILQSALGSAAWCRFLLDSADPNGNGQVSPGNFINSGNIRT